MNNEYFERIGKCTSEFRNTVLQSGLIRDEELIQEAGTQLEDNIEKLLNCDKPKIMVYGIYNSGKSTLVNAICREEIAKVAAKPTTDTITEYDVGPYVLVDSPGVNAPIEHEELADKHLNGCHVILFVISSAGIFEDRINYEKMISLIDREIPFYIVLNERGGDMPSKAEGEEKRRQAIVNHEAEINEIKRKIIKNLVKYSGNKAIGDKYEVIVVNAKRAWKGVEKGNDLLVKKSNITSLTNRLIRIIEEDGAVKQILAPLGQFEKLVLKIENHLFSQISDKDYGMRRENLQTRIMILQEEFFEGIYSCVSKYFEEVYRNCLDNADISAVWHELVEDIEEMYMRKIVSLNHYMKEAFKELDLCIDSKCNVVKMCGKSGSISKGGKSKANNHRADVIKPNVKEHFVDTSSKISKDSSLFTTLLSIFKSKSKKEEEEYERLCAEVNSFNQQQQYLLEEDIRRRQDARSRANALMDEFSRQIKQELRNDFLGKFELVIAEIDNAINYNQVNNIEIQKIIDECCKIRDELSSIRNSL